MAPFLIRLRIDAGWSEVNVHTERGLLSKRIPLVQQECLFVWGRNHKILKPKYAEQFSQVLPKSSLSGYRTVDPESSLRQYPIA